MKKLTPILTGLMLLCMGLSANNIAVNNVKLSGQDATANTTMVEFELSWDNSWRTNTLEANWDAAWVFIKYRKANEQAWYHAYLNYVDGSGSGDGHVVPAGAVVEPARVNVSSGPSQGVFVYSDTAMGQTSVNYSLQLMWDYGASGLADDDSVEIAVLALEMVYVPAGDFYLGDGDVAQESIYAFHTTSNTAALISADSVTTGISVDMNFRDDVTLEGSGIGLGNGIDTDNDGSIDNADFPTGVNAYYCMKYEITQGFYTEFLNKITEDQADLRKNVISPYYRLTISGSYPNFSCASPDRTINRISFEDLMALADWSGLRPMTECEYEKACRGPVAPFTYEYAWGNADFPNYTTYTLSNDGMPNALITNMQDTTANIWYEGMNGLSGINNGPIRNGIFAASAGSPNRENTGASYYGIMELSGNAAEMCISLAKASGRTFTNINGDGSLALDGQANVSNWPVGEAYSFIPRGGAFNENVITTFSVSDRSETGYSNSPSALYEGNGGRLVISAP